jgi:hypothetical protein
MICGENWKNGISPFAPYIEAAFSKTSLSKRIEFVNALARMQSPITSDVFKIPKILTFMEWMFNTAENEHLASNLAVKSLLPCNIPHKEDEINKIKFLNRQREKLKKSNSVVSG